MNDNTFLRKKIFEIESRDRQYKALKKMSKFLPQKQGGFFIIGIALISYQLNGRGESWRGEVADLGVLVKKEVILRGFLRSWRLILEKTKYNKRLKNMKLKRLERFLQGEEFFLTNMNYLSNLEKFNKWIAFTMNQKEDAKTIVFATKMWGRWLRIFGKDDLFPMSISVPLDSRWIKFFKKLGIENKRQMYQWIYQLSQKVNLSPLHIDGVLWPLMQNDFYKIGLNEVYSVFADKLGISSQYDSSNF